MNEKNKVKSLFESLSKKGEKALICYIVGGYPDLETSKEIIKTLIDSGADIIEIGIPFSDSHGRWAHHSKRVNKSTSKGNNAIR